MKILEIAGSGTVGTRAAGPVSSVIGHLANGFSERHHQVTLIDSPCPDARPTLAAAVSVYELPTSPVSTALPRRLSYPATVNSSSRVLPNMIRSLLERDSFDVVHVHERGHVRLLGKDCPVPLVWTAHMLNWTMERRIRKHPLALLSRRLDRAALRAVDQLVALNAQTQCALASPNVTVIPNGIDGASWPRLDRIEARRSLGIPVDEFRVTCLGRVAPEKGTHVFVRAVALARQQIPLVADAIGSLSGAFGDSEAITPYAAKVRDTAPAVQFHGFIHRDLPEYRLRLAAADAVIVPSITEPFGLVVLEALACGAWVIGSDVGGIRDVLADCAGALVPAGDAAALARAIVTHHHHGANPARATTARARATQFSWDRVTNDYVELMRRLIGEGHR